MKHLSTLGGFLVLLTSACGGGTSPTAPSRSIDMPGAFGLSVSPPTAAARVPDLARCLAAQPNEPCFSAARFGSRAMVAGAAAPGSPLNLASTVTGTSVTLVWNAPSTGDAVESYVLEAGSASGLANLAAFSTGSTATTFSTTGVAAGTYFVRVRAQNAAGVGAASNEVTVVITSGGCTAAPAAPTALTSVVNGTTVILSWTAASGSPTTYVVEAGSSPGSSNLVSSDLGGTSTTYTATGVGSGTYYIRMRARNSCGTGSASNEVVASVGGSAPTSIDGAWSGTTAQGRLYEMTVSGGGVTKITYSHSACGTVTSTTTFNTPVTVTGGSFTTTIGSAGTSTTITGTFASNSSASGTMRISFSPIPFVQPCSGSFSTTWTAAK